MTEHTYDRLRRWFWRRWCQARLDSPRHRWTWPSWSYKVCRRCGYVKGLDVWQREGDTDADFVDKAVKAALARQEWRETGRVTD